MTAAAFLPPARKIIADPDLWRPDWTSSEPRDPQLLWLDKNENTDPALQAIVSRVLAETDPRSATTYPDATPLYNVLSGYLGMPADSIVLTGGSDGMIGSMFRTFVDPGETVLLTAPTYAMYDVYAKMHGAKIVRLEYSRGNPAPRLATDAVIRAINTHRPKLLCLPNPDSPTGTVFDPSELKQIAKVALAASAMLLVDEAYHPFYPHTMAQLINNYPNLVVARTFSKAWGLTGVRLGYGMASPDVARLLQNTRPNYEVNAIAISMAVRMISDFEPEMRHSVERLNHGRDAFMTAMRDLGFSTIPGHGNFGHVAFGEKSGAIHAALADVALYRQTSSAPCLAGYSRFSATTAPQYARVIDRIRTEALRNP